MHYQRKDSLWRAFTFEYYNKVRGTRNHITLFVNPEEFNQAEPSRINITQTKGGFFVDHFGKGLKTITIRGITGFHKRNVNGREVSGHTHFLELRNLIRNWTDNSKHPNDPKDHVLSFYNWPDSEYHEVAVTAFNLLRNTGRPLFYQYNITMTCLRDITEKVTQALSDMDTYFIDMDRRTPLIRDKLYKETGFLRGIINKAIDVTKLSTGSQTWGTLIAKGKEFYDSVSKKYKTIESEISDIEVLARDIDGYVTNATSFIVKPFELVRDMAISIEDVIDSMVSVTDIPYEIVRSFREMICAIRSLSESLFRGFTNPSLFEGVSSCGSSLGISEAPVSKYNNSFEATAQLPPERSVSQVFEVPQNTVTLKEGPTDVVGVFLETDVSRTGLNYLESWSGKSVTLTYVPNNSVVVDYKVRQETEKQMIKLQASYARVIIFGDTVERIANDVYGDASRWKEIVLFNNMEYPFIVDLDFDTDIEATGMVRFYRDPNCISDIVIPIDTSVYVPAFWGTEQINFKTTQVMVLIAGVSYIDIPIVATSSGEIGNVGPGKITGFTSMTGMGSAGTVVNAISKISNITATTGGKIWNVKSPGDIIQIPTTESETVSLVSGRQESYEELFGVDILLKDGEFAASSDQNSDLDKAYGIDNLVQALNNRLNTRRRFYAYHSEYGSDIPYYIGQKNDVHYQDLTELDIKQVCLLDPRIEAIKKFSMEVDGDKISIELDALPINETTSLSLNLII